MLSNLLNVDPVLLILKGGRHKKDRHSLVQLLLYISAASAFYQGILTEGKAQYGGPPH